MYATPMKRMLAARGVTCRWFAENVLGVKVQMFDHYEAGRVKWPEDKLEKASRYFGIPRDDLRLLIGSVPTRNGNTTEAA